MGMRLPLALCLATALAAQPARAPQEPGLDRAFLARVLDGSPEAQGRPWHTFRVPPETASAVVEVVGELTAEEWRQVKFEAFLTWFRADLRRFLLEHGGTRLEAPAAGPGPHMVPIARVGF